MRDQNPSQAKLGSPSTQPYEMAINLNVVISVKREMALTATNFMVGNLSNKAA